jgi:hypothetical protein
MKPPRINPAFLIERMGSCGTYAKGVASVDRRLFSLCYLETLLHEMLHHYCPKWSEPKILKVGSQMAKAIWKQRFRRIER